MKVETIHEIGDLKYFLHNNKILCLRIYSITIEIGGTKPEPVVNYYFKSQTGADASDWEFRLKQGDDLFNSRGELIASL